MAHAGIAAVARRRDAAAAVGMVVPDCFPVTPVAIAVPMCVGQVVAPQPAAQGAVRMVLCMVRIVAVVVLDFMVRWKAHWVRDQGKAVAVEAVGCCFRLLRGENERRDHIAGPRPECRRR